MLRIESFFIAMSMVMTLAAKYLKKPSKKIQKRLIRREEGDSNPFSENEIFCFTGWLHKGPNGAMDPAVAPLRPKWDPIGATMAHGGLQKKNKLNREF